MKQFLLSMKQCLTICLLLILMGGCEKSIFDAEEKILGIATINGKEYNETILWGFTA